MKPLISLKYLGGAVISGIEMLVDGALSHHARLSLTVHGGIAHEPGIAQSGIGHINFGPGTQPLFTRSNHVARNIDEVGIF